MRFSSSKCQPEYLENIRDSRDIDKEGTTEIAIKSLVISSYSYVGTSDTILHQNQVSGKDDHLDAFLVRGKCQTMNMALAQSRTERPPSPHHFGMNNIIPATALLLHGRRPCSEQTIGSVNQCTR